MGQVVLHLLPVLFVSCRTEDHDGELLFHLHPPLVPEDIHILIFLNNAFVYFFLSPVCKVEDFVSWETTIQIELLLEVWIQLINM
mmetsp:Transcript_16220/g.15615  ORF Transcript_16220/g.15615 Transcript_16220/m.15615 type:complete len:85 (-) Transcript_16220:265-519(-)